MKILDVYAKGYAGATMGGTSFMINIEMPKDRFPQLEENGNDGYMLNILIPEPDYGDKPRFSLATKLISEDGSLSLWGEEEKFNEEEMQLIQKWFEENKLEEEAKSIKKEIEEVTKKMDEIYDKKKALYAISFDIIDEYTTLEEYKKRRKELDTLDGELKKLNKRYDVLHGR